MINLNEMKRDYIGREPRDYIVESVTVPEGLEEKVLAAMTQKRKEIEEIQKEKQEKKAAHKSVALRAAVIAAVITLMILIIPSSRQVVVSAAESAWNWVSHLFGTLIPDSQMYGDDIAQAKKDNGVYIKIKHVTVDVNYLYFLIEEICDFSDENNDKELISYFSGTISNNYGNSIDFKFSSLDEYQKMDGRPHTAKNTYHEENEYLYVVPVMGIEKLISYDVKNLNCTLQFNGYYVDCVSSSDYVIHPYYRVHPELIRHDEAFNKLSVEDQNNYYFYGDDANTYPEILWEHPYWLYNPYSFLDNNNLFRGNKPCSQINFDFAIHSLDLLVDYTDYEISAEIESDDFDIIITKYRYTSATQYFIAELKPHNSNLDLINQIALFDFYLEGNSNEKFFSSRCEMSNIVCFNGRYYLIIPCEYDVVPTNFDTPSKIKVIRFSYYKNTSDHWSSHFLPEERLSYIYF